MSALASESSIRVPCEEPFEEGMRVRPQVSGQVQLLLEHFERHLLHKNTHRKKAHAHPPIHTHGHARTRAHTSA